MTLRGPLDPARALGGLILFLWSVRMRTRGRYVSWRNATAVGPGPRPSRARSLLEFGLWVWHMRRLARMR